MEPIDEMEETKQNGQREENWEMFAVQQDRAGIVPMAPFKVIDECRQCNSLHLSQCSALEMILKAETEKEPWKRYVLVIGEQR